MKLKDIIINSDNKYFKSLYLEYPVNTGTLEIKLLFLIICYTTSIFDNQSFFS